MADSDSSSSDSALVPTSGSAPREAAAGRRMSFLARPPNAEAPEQQEIRDLAESIIRNKKRRRPSSEMKKFIGDHIGVGDSEEIAHLLEENGDACPLFIDRTSRLELHSHMAECLCLVAEKKVYMLDNHLQPLDDQLPIEIEKLEQISTSAERDNAVVLHLPDYRSELLMTPFKTELIGILVNRFRALNNRDVEVVFSNVIDFPVNAETLFEVDFTPAAEGVRMTLFCKSARGNPDT